MIPVEAWAYLPASTGGVVVWQEEEGEPVDQEVAGATPSLGLAFVFPFLRARHSRLFFELHGDARSVRWDVEPDVAAVYGMSGFDFGWRFGPGQSEGWAPRRVALWWGATGGPRLGWMSAPPWEPWVAWGLGWTTSFGVSGTRGKVRPMAEARLGLDVVAEAVTGTLDTAKVDMGWTWTPMALNASLRVGVGFD